MKKKNIALCILALIGTIVFFTYRVIITYDTARYLWLSTLLSGTATFKQWDITRGIVFPMIIKVSTMLLGANSNSFLVLMYLAYILMLVCCYKIYKDCIKTDSNLIKGIVVVLFCAMVVFNPMIFGYYHVLLTEFIAITIAITFCYISWNFMYVDFKKNKKMFVLYTLAFSLGAMFMWQIKQPYVGTVIFPLFIGSLISIIRNFKKENIVQKLIVCFITILSIVLSIFIWNITLNIFGIKVQGEKSSSGLFSKQLINGVSNYRVRTKQEERYTRDIVKNDEFITVEDKKEIEKIFDGTSQKYKSFIVLEKFDAPGNVAEKKVVFFENSQVKISDAAKYFLQTLSNSPSAYFKNLIDNYLTMANVYKLDMTDNVFFIEKDDINWGTICENSIIGYKIYIYDGTNTFSVPEDLQQCTENYVDSQKPIVVVNFVMQKLEIVSTVLFKVAIVVLPFYLIGLIVVQVVLRKKISDDNKKVIDLSVILAGFSFLHIMLHVFLAAFIDRYAMPTTVTLYVSYILASYLIYKIVVATCYKK